MLTDSFRLLSIVAYVVVFMLGLLLGAYSSPKGISPLYERGRKLLSVGFICCAVVSAASIYTISASYPDGQILLSIVSTTGAYFQTMSMLLAVNCIAGLNTFRMKFERSLTIVGTSILIVIALLATLLYSSVNALNWLLVLTFLIYFVSTASVAAVFVRFRSGSNKDLNEGKDKRERIWIIKLFFIASGPTVILPLAVLAGGNYHTAAVVLNAVVCIIYTIKYINYPNLFPHQTTMVSLNTETYSMEKLSANLRRWAEDKKFLTPGVTLESLSTELGTNQTYLSRCVNETMGSDFKSWLRDLRIEEAKKIIGSKKFTSIADTAEICGIPNRNTFIRQFTKSVGISPVEYRNRFAK